MENRSVGAWKFLGREWEITGDADLDDLDQWLSDQRPKERTIIRMKVGGYVSLKQQARLAELLEDYDAPLAALDVDDRALLASPDETDVEEFGLSGFALEAVRDLTKLAEEGEDALAARDALVLLRRLIRECR